MKSYVIHLIRHGAIDETLSGKYSGTTDPPLSDKGKLALKKLAFTHAYPQPPVVFSSPLRRCTQTCAVLFPERKPLVIDLKSIKSPPECYKQSGGMILPVILFYLIHKLFVVRKGFYVFQCCVCKIFESIVEGLMKTGSTECAVVTHGGVIMTLLAVYGLPQAKPFEWAMENGCGYSVRVTPMLWQRGKVTEVFSRVPVAKEE